MSEEIDRRSATSVLFLGDKEPPKNLRGDEPVTYRGVVQAAQVACANHQLSIIFDDTDVARTVGFMDLSQLSAGADRVCEARFVIVFLDHLTVEQQVQIAVAHKNDVPVLALTTDLSDRLPANCEPFRASMTVVRFDCGPGWTMRLTAQLYDLMEELLS